MIRTLFSILFVVAVGAIAVAPVTGQRRDSMTEAEIELVRNSQDIDKRIDVLTKMLDRRFGALGIEVGGWKQTDKGKEEWGEIRTGTKSELLLDIRAIFQKAIDDVDDVAMHNENTLTQNKTEGLLFPKAVRSLAAAAARYLPQLKATLEKTTDEKERGLIIASIEHCEAILDSVTKLPPETKPEKKKGKS
ncbi:MAG: hypothetical protein H0U23_05220 [Blastocatellia bacterium]|nr:hypothetical protein [Blastocatellia bacterium]